MPRKINSLFRMPAEWEKQQSTLIGWPYNKNDWPGKFKNIPNVFAKIISKITKSQEVNLLIKNSSSKNTIKKLLKKNNAKIRNVKFIICKTNRVWMRDTGPIFIKNNQNQNILLNWKFNGWAKYKNYGADNKVSLKIKNHYKGNIINPKFNKKSIVLEGGSIDVNGNGLFLTTKDCLLSKIQQRNSFLKIKNYNHIFKKFFGCETRNRRNMLILSSYMQRFLLHSLCNYSLCLHSASNSFLYIVRNTIWRFSGCFIINFICYVWRNILFYPCSLFSKKFFAQSKYAFF